MHVTAAFNTTLKDSVSNLNELVFCFIILEPVGWYWGGRKLKTITTADLSVRHWQRFVTFSMHNPHTAALLITQSTFLTNGEPINREINRLSELVVL